MRLSAMLTEQLYALTKEQFDVFELRPFQEQPGSWQVSATRLIPHLQAPGEIAVGRGASEDSALRDLRLQLVIKTYGDYRG